MTEKTPFFSQFHHLQLFIFLSILTWAKYLISSMNCSTSYFFLKVTMSQFIIDEVIKHTKGDTAGEYTTKQQKPLPLTIKMVDYVGDNPKTHNYIQNLFQNTMWSPKEISIQQSTILVKKAARRRRFIAARGDVVIDRVSSVNSSAYPLTIDPLHGIEGSSRKIGSKPGQHLKSFFSCEHNNIGVCRYGRLGNLSLTALPSDNVIFLW